MNINKFSLATLLVCTALAAVSCAKTKGAGLGGAIPGSGNINTETRNTGPFEAIALEYPAEVTIQQGAKDIVWIQADDNLIPQISTEVDSGRLTIKIVETDWNARVNPSKPVKIAITVRNPKEISFLAPVGTLEVNDVQADTLRLVLSGAGELRLNGIQVDLLDTVLSGAGDIQVAGAAGEIKLVLSGLGNFNAADLKSNKATIEISGTGDATVRVETQLTATIKGAGSVNYLGEPRVEQSITGLGSVRPVGQGN